MPSSGTLMDDVLRFAGLLPLTEPYTALGYSFIPASSTGASTTQSLFNTTSTNAIVDRVVVENRSANAPFTIRASRPALEQRDGDVVDPDGDQYVNFLNVTAGNYRVAVRHRDHLGIKKGGSTAQYLGLIPTGVSLRQSNAAIYGTNATTTISGVKCIWTVDANHNGKVSYTGTNNDRDTIVTAFGRTDPTNTISNTYGPLDVNMDGVIRYTGTNNDWEIILQTIGGVVPTVTRVEQVP